MNPAFEATVAALSPWPQILAIVITAAIAGAIFSNKRLDWLKKILTKPWL